MTADDTPDDRPATFVHQALFYRGPVGFLAGTTGFVRAALELGDPVMVAVPEPNLTLLREELGTDAAGVTLVDMARVGRNPGRLIPAVLREFVDSHPRGRPCVVGEPIWPGRDPDERAGCTQHEALVNLAFAGCAATFLCTYDAAVLTPAVLADAAATHPVLIQDGRQRASDTYDHGLIIRRRGDALTDPPVEPEVFPFDTTTLADVRAIVVEAARRAGIAEDRALDAELAASELAANSLAHGGGKGTLRAWVEDRHLLLDISDAGRITDPLAGGSPGRVGVPGGRGLFLVQQLADLVLIQTGRTGTTVRIRFAR